MSNEIRASQLIDKTITLEQKTPFFRAFDVNRLGFKAIPIGNGLPIGYRMTIDSFLLKGPEYISRYGIKYAERKDDYLTFSGKDGKYYAVKLKDIKLSKAARQSAGILTVEEEEEQNLSTTDRLIKFGKKILIGVVVVWAAGYIYKQTKK
jgi:hypothetical protein